MYDSLRQFERKPLYAAVLGGIVAIAPILTGAATQSGATNAANTCNPRAVLRLAASCNPCARKKCNPCAAKCNPCAAKCNPCAAKRACNPCAAKCNPCAAKCNPCAAKRACNPCAAKCNPCAAKCNPCAAKRACNPCAAKCNPCAAKRACNPCAAKGCNPCSAKGCNPCAGGKIAAKAFKRPCGVSFPVSRSPALIAKGEALWNDTKLSSNGLACGTCHQSYGNLSASFANPYPHEVAMPKQRAGVRSVSADEMVQFCLLVPMQTKTMAWDSVELAALTAYTVAYQQGFNPCKAAKAGACNPCNPCAAKGCNPCNPCAAKRCNPCAAKRACNPCNPCAAKKKN